jgi:hypothetical protein
VSWLAVGEVEELHLRSDEEGVAGLLRLGQVAAQYVPRVALERATVGDPDVTEHPSGRAAVGPREQLEGGRIGLGENVRLLHSAEAVDGGPVEVHTLFEGGLELDRRDRHGLQLAQNIGEPESDQLDVSLFDCSKHIFLLSFHPSISNTFHP